ncbi:HAMP domain-containing sensor histidine kinase [Paenibacillus sp. MMS20-IR301]|uniref:sensor histidine kinase n=1 Tax=Paenibacillus sp. MMS20-IR301 TaxID=2895946 RepID=UPI0028E8EAE0|nr:HAMP domain-containing sensor histidine kinase [Paenibacillus sp. MMS20-IR301]WNS43087.1 HAMP domain-containing sensor histidine kinase [Paenibacillus sp. MMS20-IR301]
MRKSIVSKLFLLTLSLSLFLLASLFIGQILFFERFYIHQKSAGVQSALNNVATEPWEDPDNDQKVFETEQQFYRTHNTWLARLNSAGYLSNTGNFEAEVRLENVPEAPALSGTTLTIPMYTMMDVEELREDNPLVEEFFVQPEKRIALEGLLINNQFIPQRIAREASKLWDQSHLENTPFVLKEYEVVSRYTSATDYREHYPSILVYGTVTKLQTPIGAAESRYTNHLFLEQIKAFQAKLLYDEFPEQDNTVMDYTTNDVPYKIIVNRHTDSSGAPFYLFAMTSLQPVNEAAGVMRQYYLYIAIVALLLVALVSLYFSRRLARPLLRVNQVTQQMASLDFSARIPVNTGDEIGQLSDNINKLSRMLHGHIHRLEQDIEQERRLEQTRKAFIADVSHELKTPLSIMESCLYIIEDKPDSPKREHYFSAMKDEVQKMNLLVGDMLELAKYESGTYKMQMDIFRIDVLLEQVCTKLALDISSRQLLLLTRLVPVEVAANARLIEQVVVNLLTNAIRYTPEGEKIMVRMKEEQQTVIITIENNGVRIPDEQLNKIWDRFYRIEQSRHRSTGGTGLGLAICRQILKLHDARYGAVNTETGVQFYFELNTKNA